MNWSKFNIHRYHFSSIEPFQLAGSRAYARIALGPARWRASRLKKTNLWMLNFDQTNFILIIYDTYECWILIKPTLSCLYTHKHNMILIWWPLPNKYGQWFINKKPEIWKLRLYSFQKLISNFVTQTLFDPWKWIYYVCVWVNKLNCDSILIDWKVWKSIVIPKIVQFHSKSFIFSHVMIILFVFTFTTGTYHNVICKKKYFKLS